MTYPFIPGLFVLGLIFNIFPVDQELKKRPFVVEPAKGSRTMSQNNSPADRFDTLEDYLSYLEEKGKMDWPFYKLVGTDRYKLMLGRGGNRMPAQYFTRQQLAKKFGFR